jgi:hypothetical protein
MSSDSERIAILETKTESIQQTLKRVDSNVSTIKEAVSKQKGFIAGVMFVIAPISVIVAAAAKELLQVFTNQ